MSRTPLRWGAAGPFHGAFLPTLRGHVLPNSFTSSGASIAQQLPHFQGQCLPNISAFRGHFAKHVQPSRRRPACSHSQEQFTHQGIQCAKSTHCSRRAFWPTQSIGLLNRAILHFKCISKQCAGGHFYLTARVGALQPTV